MKHIKDFLVKESTMETTSDLTKLNMLLRMGLISPGKLLMVKRALGKQGVNLSQAERMATSELIDNLLDQIMGNQQIYNKVKSNLMAMHEELNGEELELIDEANLSTAMSDFPKIDKLAKGDINQDFPNDRQMPSVLIMKRKAIRIYPDNQRVALYYIQALDKYVTIPFGNVLSVNEENKGSKNGIKVSFPWKTNKHFDDLHKKLDPHTGGTTIKDHSTMHWHWSFLTPEKAKEKGTEVAKAFKEHGVKHEISYYSGINEEVLHEESYGKGHPDHDEIVMSALNHFGTGEHPSATKQSLPYFNKSYVKDCLGKACHSVKPEHKDKLESAIKWLGGNNKPTIRPETHPEKLKKMSNLDESSPKDVMKREPKKVSDESIDKFFSNMDKMRRQIEKAFDKDAPGKPLTVTKQNNHRSYSEVATDVFKKKPINEISKELFNRYYEKRAADIVDKAGDTSDKGLEKSIRNAEKFANSRKLAGKTTSKHLDKNSTIVNKIQPVVRPWASKQTQTVADLRATREIDQNQSDKEEKQKKVNDNSVTKLVGTRQKIGADPIQGGWEGVGDLAVRGTVGMAKLVYKGAKKLMGNKSVGSTPMSEQTIDESKDKPVSHYHFTVDKGDPEGQKKIDDLRAASKGTHIVKLRGRGPRDSAIPGKYKSYLPASKAEKFAVYTYPKETQNADRERPKHDAKFDREYHANQSWSEKTSYRQRPERDGRFGYDIPNKLKEEEIRDGFKSARQEQINEVLPLIAGALAAARVATVAGPAIGRAIVGGSKIASRVAGTAVKGAGRTLKRVGTAAIANSLTKNNNTNNSNADTDLGGPKNPHQSKEFSGDRMAGSTKTVSGQRNVPTATSQGDFTSPTQTVAYRKQMVTPMREQIDILRKSVEQNINEIAIVAGKDTFNINNSTAKKLLEVYDSVNKKNKIKMIDMLSENKESFEKIIKFAQDYTKR